MQIHGLQASNAVQSAVRTGSAKSAGPVQSAPAANAIAADQLDFSSEAQEILNSPATSDGLRSEKVASIRQAIADGSYETPEKLDAALDRLLDTFA